MMVNAAVSICAFVVGVCLADPQQGANPPLSSSPVSPTGQVLCGETPANVCLADPQQGANPPLSSSPVSPTGQVLCGETPANMFDCLQNPKVIQKNKLEKCRGDLSECDRIKCVFRQSGWALPGDKVDKQKVIEYFNQFAVENSAWSAAVQHSKLTCLEKGLSPQGVTLNCEPYDVMHCIQTSFVRNAAASQWKTTPECAYPRSFAASCPLCPTNCFATQVPYGSCNACLSLPRTP